MFVKTFYLVFCFISGFKETKCEIVKNPLNLREGGYKVCSSSTSRFQTFYATVTYTRATCVGPAKCNMYREVTRTKTVQKSRTVSIKTIECCYGWKKKHPSSTDCSKDAIDDCRSNPCDHICQDRPFYYVCRCHSCFTKVGKRRCELRQCKINNHCYAYRTVNPSNPCQVCESHSKYRWTNNNYLKCSDNNIRTRDDRCLNGRCVGTPYTCLACETYDGSACPIRPGYCVIYHHGKKTCFARNHYKPGNLCQWCNPQISTSAWSSRHDGVVCDDKDQCTRGDVCSNGLCTGRRFNCDSRCQYCNGNSCSLKIGFGFRSHKCTCKIAGRDYVHQGLNPSNYCQWCDLYDATARAKSAWSNRPEVSCNDGNKCTKQDTCKAGSCSGQGYPCQSWYPSSKCIRTSECVGDGNCVDIIRPSGTICRPAADICDRPEKYCRPLS